MQIDGWWRKTDSSRRSVFISYEGCCFSSDWTGSIAHIVRAEKFSSSSSLLLLKSWGRDGFRLFVALRARAHRGPRLMEAWILSLDRFKNA
jgi:hypothetical protein